ncbi:Dual specificity protein phosphatase 1 [Hypsizygus marmoreus]|uniref:protein-tyrosine-phosphatase n=1 Tax=Hypsizygus marmoreus TaxID=39966 RepID=A0A369JNR3_HYPMA|nr:Dual specificity protein phosphatase 1 [Hypsizygus marmoreus]
MSAPKRSRPPNINLSLATQKRPPIELEAESPIDLSDDDDDDDDEFEDTLQLSSGESSPTTPPSIPTLKLDISDDESSSDDISKDLAALEQLRKNVKQNLRLRPIRSHSALPKVDLNGTTPKSPFPTSATPWRDSGPLSATSPASSTASSYFTPLSATHRSSPPPSARLVFSDSKSDSTSDSSLPHPIEPGVLYERLTSPTRPLLIDTRPPTSHVSFHIRHSINIAIPSLILKRCRKPGGGFQSLDALRQFITTDSSKRSWDDLMSPGGPWDGSVVIYDDEMDPKDKDNVGVTAWALIPVLAPLVTRGSVDYLQGGISAAGHHPDLETLILSGGEFDFGFNVDSPPPQAGGGGLKKGGGLFQLDTQSALRSKALPEIEPSSTVSTIPPSPPPRSPLPLMPAGMSSSRAVNTTTHRDHDILIVDPTPSPPPSQISFHRPPPPHRRPSVPTLRRIDTKSAERLNANSPNISVRTRPLRSATLTVPPSLSLQAPTSPSHLSLVYSSHSPPASARFTPSSPSPDVANFLTPYYTPPHTPGTPKPFLPPSPSTAKPDLDNPPTTEESYPVFTISTILPNFLYLGPELTAPEHVEELQDLGVKRILNIAAECDDDQGLSLKQAFDKYYKIPMRDIVEEENIARGVKEVCEILDDARLHSAPTYVHCKAGKSRSVTAVMAYLIHANHWTLSRAYSFVLERRKGISPNIGFVSELMSFEEQELGGKSIGVHPSAPAGSSQYELPGQLQDSYGAAVGAGGHLRRGGHVRESLPPAALGGTGMETIMDGGSVSAGGRIIERVNGDSGQEMEIKDASGRYRHARRAPVDENTLQPLRRVSKAGLETSAYA